MMKTASFGAEQDFLENRPTVRIMRILTIQATLLACLSCGVAVLGATGAYDVGAMSSAKDLYYRAVAGDESARKQSAEEFGRLFKRNPDDPEVMVYRGSLTLMEANKTWALWRKYELSKEGIVLMDEAVRVAPDNLEVRFVRAATTRKLPSFFERGEQSKQDLEFLAERVGPAARKGELDPALASAALYFYAKDVATGEAKTRALQQAVKLAPESRAGVESATALGSKAR